MQSAFYQKFDKVNNGEEVNDYQSNSDRTSLFFHYLPSMKEFKINGLNCENSFKECNLFEN